MMPDFSHLCGWRSNPRGVTAVLNDPRHRFPVFNVGAAAVLAGYTKQDTHLWAYILKCNPSWRRGAQGIGDCVSWGLELAATTNWAKECVKRRQLSRFREVATEPIYGGARVEARGGRVGGWQDGAYGAAAADWVHKWGVLFREDYSSKTGNQEHNLDSYSANKARNWGNYGCGGKSDSPRGDGPLDLLNRANPVKTVSQVNSFDDAAGTIAGAKCPVTIASSYGCSMVRNRYGECRWDRSWPHQMVLLGVRFGARPGVHCFQSWGPRVASGPSGDEYTENLPPGGTPAAILGTSWWIPAGDFDRVARSGDCWAIGDVDGWRIDRANFSTLIQGIV